MSGGSAYLRVDGRKLQGGSQKGQDLLAGLYIANFEKEKIFGNISLIYKPLVWYRSEIMCYVFGSMELMKLIFSWIS